MKFDLVEIQKGDVILSPIDIGNLAPDKVDAWMKKVAQNAHEVFGCKVALLPVRGGNWDFTIIRNPNRKVEPPTKSSRKKLKKVA